MNKFLIVIDMQNDFVNGSLGSKEAQQIVPNVKNKIIDLYNDRYKIIFTQDTHDENYLDTFEGQKLPVKHCIKNTHGWQIIDDLNISCEGKHINKSTFGYLDWLNILEVPADCKDLHIELVGVCTDICVIANAIILRTLFPNAEIKVDSACCAGSSPEAHNATLLIMKSCQIDVI